MYVFNFKNVNLQVITFSEEDNHHLNAKSKSTKHRGLYFSSLQNIQSGQSRCCKKRSITETPDFWLSAMDG